MTLLSSFSECTCLCISLLIDLCLPRLQSSVSDATLKAASVAADAEPVTGQEDEAPGHRFCERRKLSILYVR